MNKILHGDSLHVLKTLETGSVDLVCTDPPYGYSFMGKAWDKALPDIGIFKECLRVLKPGAFAFVMSAPRSDVCSRMATLLEDAGFNIAFTLVYWTYASGLPKAMNIGKMVDKREGLHVPVMVPTKPGNLTEMAGDVALGATGFTDVSERVSDAAKALDGSYGGFQPKPAVEVIIVAMKPLSEKTYVDQALKNGKGVTWLDDCRVPTDTLTPRNNRNTATVYAKGFEGEPKTVHPHEGGRFPANLLVSDDVLNDGVERKSGKPQGVRNTEGGYGGAYGGIPVTGFGDSGSYSRFFSLDAWAQTLPFLAVPKASKSEKNRGLESRETKTVSDGRSIAADNAFQRGKTERNNTHPTVKPLKLMSYLIILGSRPGDIVLDPFAGSGTTCVAAKELGRNFIGVEREQEYVEIAETRLQATNPALV